MTEHPIAKMPSIQLFPCSKKCLQSGNEARTRNTISTSNARVMANSPRYRTRAWVGEMVTVRVAWRTREVKARMTHIQKV